MKWQTRFVLRSMLPLVPFQNSFHALKRKFTDFNAENAEGVFRFICIMLRQLFADGFEPCGKTVLEIGTGGEPQLPLILKVAGCGPVMTVDRARILDLTSCKRTVDFLINKRSDIIHQLGITPSSFDGYIQKISYADLNAFFNTASINYTAPLDARRLPLADGSVDLIISNNVLEHIPPAIISSIFREFLRVLHPKGIMAHTIDNSDHWAYTDHSISRANYLRYEDSFWKCLQINPIDYQNRLRHFEYLRLFSETGFSVSHDFSEIDKEVLDALKSLPLCSKYRQVPHEKLAVCCSRIISVKKT